MISTRELLTGLISLLTGALMTYSVKAVSLEGRIVAIETSLQRIENRLYSPGVIIKGPKLGESKS